MGWRLWLPCNELPRIVLPAPPNRVGPNSSALCVTMTRDPRSAVIGWLFLGVNVVETLNLSRVNCAPTSGWWFGPMEFDDFPWLLGMSWSQLTIPPSFFRGEGWNHQPEHVFELNHGKPNEFWVGHPRRMGNTHFVPTGSALRMIGTPSEP